MSSVLLPSSACFTVHNSHALNTKDNNQKDNPGSLGSQLGRAPLARCLLLPLPSPGVRRPYFSVFPLSGSRRLAAAHTPSGRHPSFFLFHAHSPPSALICLQGPAGRRPPATACCPGTTVRFGSPPFLLFTALLFLLSSSIEDRGVNMARSVNVGQQIVFVASFQRNFLSSS